MLDNGYTKKFNFLENNVRKFTNIADGNHDFNIHNVRNCNSLYFYGILNTRIECNLYKLPNKQFKNIHCLVDNIQIDNGIPNDIESYMILKDKSIHKDNFLINYSDFIENYRIYSFNLDRVIKDDNSNKFINITYQAVSNNISTVYAVFKTYATITMKYNKTNGLIVYNILKDIEIGYNFDKKSLDKIKRFKNPVLDIHKNKINKNNKYKIFLNKSQFNNLLENHMIKYKLTDARKNKIIMVGNGLADIFKMMLPYAKNILPKLATTVGLSSIGALTLNAIHKNINKKERYYY